MVSHLPPLLGLCRGLGMYTPLMENHMENEMVTGIIEC